MGDSALVSKVLYKKLLSVESSPPILYRQWSQVIGPGFSLDDHWSLVRDPFTENFKNDVIWLIILLGVKVRDSLFNWGVISSSQCASCPLNLHPIHQHCTDEAQKAETALSAVRYSSLALQGFCFHVQLEFSYCAGGLCFCGGKKTRVHYLCLVLIVRVSR